MMYEGVMFDLDGTLADTLADLAAAGNHMLGTFGLDPLPVDRYRQLVGRGGGHLVRHALGPDYADQHQEALRRYSSYYAEHRFVHSGPYDGVPDLLDALAGRDLKLAVLSNKGHTATLEVVNTLLGRWSFDVVRGHQPPAELKPHPGAALAIAEELNIPPERWVYVGDTDVDMQTGTAAGMHTVGVTWGFRDEAELREHGADAIIHHPLELLDLLPASASRA